MSDEKKIDSLFEQAILIRSAKARGEFVREACGEDEGLRRELEQLLRSDGVEDSFLEKPILDLQETMATEASTDSHAPSLGAGAPLSFDKESSVVVGDTNQSVLRSLGNTVDEIPHISLREPARRRSGADRAA